MGRHHRPVRAIGAAVLAVVLAACASAASSPGTAGSTSAPASTTDPVTSAGDRADEPATSAADERTAAAEPSAADATSEPATRATAPAGFRPVTFHGVTVDVPAEWTTDGTHCGRPIEPTVVLAHAAVPACGLGTIPAVPSLELGVLPPPGRSTSPLDSGVWTPTTAAGVAALRQDSPATPTWAVVTSAVAFPDRRAVLTVRAPEQSAVDAILATLRPDTVDVNGCPAQIDVTDPLAVGHPAVRPDAGSTVIPDGATSMTVCTYGDGLIESSGALDDTARATLTTAIDAAPAGLSIVDPATYATDGCAPDGFFVSPERVLRLLVGYPAGPEVTVTARLSQCGTSGVSNGTVVHQITDDLTLALMDAGHLESGPGAFIPAG